MQQVDFFEKLGKLYSTDEDEKTFITIANLKYLGYFESNIILISMFIIRIVFYFCFILIIIITMKVMASYHLRNLMNIRMKQHYSMEHQN